MQILFGIGMGQEQQLSSDTGQVNNTVPSSDTVAHSSDVTQSNGTIQPLDCERRFGGVNRLYGEHALETMAQSSAMIVGLGGVGSWTAEALARSGIGRLVLADMDHIAESNINRQIHALSSTLGQSKIEALAQRAREINPALHVDLIDDFIDTDNADTLIKEAQVDVLIDCADQVSAKVAMILVARRLRLPLLVCGGAGGKQQSLALRYSDLSQVRNDALLAKIRQQLRSRHGFAKGSDAQGRALKKAPKMGVSCLWIDEPAQSPWSLDVAPQGLACAGYGSCVTVTAAMGLAAANQALQLLFRQSR